MTQTNNEREAFKREERYIVIKISDAHHLDTEQQNLLFNLLESVNEIRSNRGKNILEAVCVESDWPEYETVWAMIQDRVAGGHKSNKKEPSFDIADRLKKLASREIEGEIKEFEYSIAADEIIRLRAQLPEQMQDCTIIFKECEHGHGTLTAANWIQHECQTCLINSLRKQSPISQNEQQEAVAERDKLGYAVVEVIGKLDEIIDVAEDIEFNDFAHIAIPLELWNELKDALELMPERADKFTSPPKQAIPEGWISVKDRLPSSQQIVLFSDGRSIKTVMYVGKHDINTDDWRFEDGAEYFEDEDASYWPEGWYEHNSHDEMWWDVGFPPTHWMPLPSAPTNTEVGNDR